MMRLNMMRVVTNLCIRDLYHQNHCLAAYQTQFLKKSLLNSTSVALLGTNTNIGLNNTNTDSSLVIPVSKTSLDLLNGSQHGRHPQLQSQYPVPPSGKMNLIKDGVVSHVTPTELYGQLKHLTAEFVLQTVASNYADMDKIHFAVALKRLNEVRLRLEEKQSQQFVQEMIHNDRFQVLVALITRKGRFYDADIIFNIYRSLAGFGFAVDHPSRSVFQSLIRQKLNSLHLDQLIELVYLGRSTSHSREGDLIYHGVKALVPHRTDQLKLLDDFQMLKLLDLFPGLIKKHIPTMLRNIKRELIDAGMNIDHHYAFLLLRALQRIKVYSFNDEDLLKLAVVICHQQRHQYMPNDLLTILRLFRNLGYYQSAIYNDFAELFCDDASVQDISITHKVAALHCFCRQSHSHRGLFENIESCFSADADHLSATDLLHYIACCWTFNYRFMNEGSPRTIMELLVNKLAQSSQGIHVDTYLQLCLILASYRGDLPDELINTQIELCQDDETVHTLIQSSNIRQAPDEACEMQGDTSIKVLMSKTDNDLGKFHENYCRGWDLQRSEVTHLLKHLWKSLPDTLQQIHNISVAPEVMSKPSEIYLYIIAAASDCNIQCGIVLDCGLHADYLLTKKSSSNQDDVKSSSNQEDVSDRCDLDTQKDITNNYLYMERLVVKVMPTSVAIRNKPGLKRLAELYMSALREQGYKCLVVTNNAWLDIPHEEKTSYLQVKINEAFAQDGNEDIFVV